MRILVVSPRQCWPPRNGAKLREYHFIRALAKRAEVDYLHFTEPGSAPLTQNDLPFCHEVVSVPKPNSYGTLKLVQGILGRCPLTILNYSSRGMNAAVERLTTAARYDLVHLDSIHMIRCSQYAGSGSAPRFVYNWHNIESEAMRRFSATVPSPAKRWYARQTAAKLEEVEREILQTAFGHIVCSERERLKLQAIVPAARIGVIENGVDTGYFSRAPDDHATSRQIVFVGWMEYYPNIEAATSFARNIWPAVRKSLPDIQFVIVGLNPVASVRALAELPGITVTGTVPDLRPYYRDALAAIVPLRTGGGTRLKILEAMAAGVPVISTPLGAEGLPVTSGVNILLAEPDDAGAWVAHLRNLAESSARREQIASTALNLVRERYDWETLGTILFETYAAWLDEAG